MVNRSPMRTVPELFESVVATSPDAPAVVFKDRTLTYAQLNYQANRLARHLIGRGVGPDSLVAVAIPRSIELLVVVLAVLKAGGAYLPLDPGYPTARLSYMMTDARPVLLVRTGDVRISDAGIPEINVDEPEFVTACEQESGDNIAAQDRREHLRPTHLMYVIYTSGSSGTPKGVAVTHYGVSDLVATQAARFQVNPGDRVLQWASISFDAAFWDLALALLSGATLVMANSDDLLPGDPLRDTLIRYDITHAVLPPVALSITDSDGVLKGATIMSTGDACTPTLVREWSRGRRMFNGYGPTEVTVGATIAGPIEDADEVSIGHPWIGGQVHVLDERLRPVPDGEEGELYLAGTGLARGYLNRPGMTATRFIPEPFGPPGSRMYRSGDRGWRSADGEFHFTGRADDQVKVRGFRIELGEIEACLASQPEVDLAVAFVEGELADAGIVGCVTTQQGATVSAADLRSAAAASLPEHMVPARIVVLDRFPTLSNGKIDRRALRGQPSTVAPVVPGPAVIPARKDVSYEEVLCGMVMELLSLSAVDLNDNLFQLGGNSVVAARLASSIRKELGVRLPIRAVFEAETLSDLAHVIHSTQQATRGNGSMIR